MTKTNLTRFHANPQQNRRRLTAKKVLENIGADFRFEVPGQSSVGLICGGRGQWLGGHHGECGAEPPAGPGAEPLVRGAKPPKAESILVTGCATEPANLAPLVRFSK